MAPAGAVFHHAFRIITPSHVAAPDQAHGLAGKIEAALRPPFVLGSYQHTISASANVEFALFSGEELASDSLFKQADQAMYAVKRGRQGVSLAPETLQET